MNLELTDGNELATILLLTERLNEIKQEAADIKKKINILKNNMENNKYSREITIKCKNLTPDEIQYIYRFLNKLSLEYDGEEQNISYTSKLI